MYNLRFHRSFDTWKSAKFVQELKKWFIQDSVHSNFCWVRVFKQRSQFIPLYSPTYSPGWPGVLPQGQADDMCITRFSSLKFLLSSSFQTYHWILSILKAVDIDNVSEFAPFHFHCREHLHRSSIIISTRCFKFLPYFQKSFKIFHRLRVICKMSLCYDATDLLHETEQWHYNLRRGDGFKEPKYNNSIGRTSLSYRGPIVWNILRES